MKLHHVQGSRSCRVRWLLEELGLDYALETYSLADGTLKGAAYRAKNPLGLVPTLEDGGVVLFESGAILQYLLERYGEGRLEPEIGTPERARYLQWFHWGEATMMPPLGDIMRQRFLLPEEKRSEAGLEDARKRLSKCLGALAAEVEEGGFVAGSEFSAADIMMAYGPHLARMVGELPDEPKAVHDYLARVGARPAFERAFGPGGF
jgi:glutathione S-transferase